MDQISGNEAAIQNNTDQIKENADGIKENAIQIGNNTVNSILKTIRILESIASAVLLSWMLEFK